MIEVNNLVKIYNAKEKSSKVALDNISFRVKKGEIISIIGKTGSGKTTIADLLLGLIKPSEGEIIIDNDIVINKKTNKKELRRITDVLLSSFQYPDHQLFKPTVKEEILFNTIDKEEKVKEMLKLFSLEESILEKSPFRLSSGQKRKVILISLLIKEPKILVLDESTSFLDSRTRKDFISLIKKINKEIKTTIIFISHNMEDVKEVSNKTLLIENGKQIMFGKTELAIKKYIGGDSNE